VGKQNTESSQHAESQGTGKTRNEAVEKQNTESSQHAESQDANNSHNDTVEALTGDADSSQNSNFQSTEQQLIYNMERLRLNPSSRYRLEDISNAPTGLVNYLHGRFPSH